MASWEDLDSELEHWASRGLTATLWWRDDDAAELTPEVERLISLAERSKIAVHLAVIPARLSGDLAAVIGRSPQARVLQHGYAHIDHAPEGEGRWELGPHRPRSEVLGELKKGFAQLSAAFHNKFLPVLVPPWTRIDAGLVPHLAEAGFRGLSMEGPRRELFAAPKLKLINAHCDPIKWKGGPRFTGAERALDEIVRHLVARREGPAGRDEPTGLCTHHLAHDAETWDFVEALIGRTTAHPAVHWIGLEAELGIEAATC